VGVCASGLTRSDLETELDLAFSLFDADDAGLIGEAEMRRMVRAPAASQHRAPPRTTAHHRAPPRTTAQHHAAPRSTAPREQHGRRLPSSPRHLRAHTTTSTTITTTFHHHHLSSLPPSITTTFHHYHDLLTPRRPLAP
jgi:hypothetical protein